MVNQYCSKCGRIIKQDEIVYPDMRKWAKEYDEAKRLDLPLPEAPGPAITKCCNTLPIWPPTPALEIPPFLPDTRRVESTNFPALIRLCDVIGKSPHSIWAYQRLDIIPSLFGPSIFFIDVKADYFKRRIDQFLETGGLLE